MATHRLTTIVMASSTLPASATDPVAPFVKEQVIALKQLHPELDIHVIAPYDAYTKPARLTRHEAYTEYRFHYFWPHRLELLAGRGIVPALKARPWLYALVPFFLFFEMIAIFRVSRRVKPDLLYMHWFMPQVICAALVARILKLPLVFTTHASDVAILKGIPGTKALVRSICRQTVAFTAVSKQTAQRLRAFWPANATNFEEKLSIIPMGTASVSAVPKPVTNPYQGKQVITFIGRLVERKGVANLIQAFQALAKNQPQAILVIAGDGQDRADFESLANKAGLGERCNFVGFVSGSAKADLLASTDILCIPSVEGAKGGEGLPVVLMEGLAAGTCVVASDSTGAQEYLTNNKDGFIYPQDDVAALTIALNEALQLSEPARTSLQQSARDISQNFSWPHVAQQHYDVLQSALHDYRKQ